MNYNKNAFPLIITTVLYIIKMLLIHINNIKTPTDSMILFDIKQLIINVYYIAFIEQVKSKYNNIFVFQLLLMF